MSEGNPNIAKYGEATRFGQEGAEDPAQAARKKWSVRESIRHYGVMDDDELNSCLKERKPSQFEKAALKKISLAIKGNVTALQQLEDTTDGKLVEKKIEVRTDSYAALVAAAAEMEKAEKNDRTD